MKKMIYFATTSLIIGLITTVDAHTHGTTNKNTVTQAHVNIGETKTDLVIAVIDTGVDIDNPKIKPYLYQNSGETGLDSKGNNKSHNQIDDDHNGFIDDVNGWNFYDNNNNVKDDHGHGSHVISIIIEKLKSHHVSHFKILPIKYFSESDSKKTSNLIHYSNKSFEYALKFPIKLVNYSGGGYEKNTQEEDLIKQLNDKNIILVAASGNQKVNTDQNPYYPASLNYPNIFSVGASLSETLSNKTDFSNYGKKTVTLFAPGKNILGFNHQNRQVPLSGTSQATAYATATLSYLLTNQLKKTKIVQVEKIKGSLCSMSLKIQELNASSQCPINLNIDRIAKFKTDTEDAFGN